MKRNIVKIDEDKCTGCGLCIDACHEGALQLIDGKARLVSESYCDGLGNCLPECPVGAITIEEREAMPFDEEAVKAYIEHNKQNSKQTKDDVLACGCPGKNLKLHADKRPGASPAISWQDTQPAPRDIQSELMQWPCQLKLVPVNAYYFDHAHLLIAADCTAFAYANIHQKYMRNKITLIGCPKLDDTDYSEKLAAILSLHDIKSITVLRMEVPCCGGIVNAVRNAMISSGKMIPWNVVTISTDGEILEE